MEKIAVYGATRNLYARAMDCAVTALDNGHVDRIYILTEDDDVKTPRPEIQTINVARQIYFSKTGPNATKRWTWMVLIKAALSQLFPELDLVLWLDCDTIVHHDLSELWQLDMTDYYYGMALQYDDGRQGKFSEGRPYFNAGVMLCNLKRLRDMRLDHLLINSLNQLPYEFNEQDAINELCQDRILTLPGRYNVSDYTVPDGETWIRHYAADPTWGGTRFD